MSFITPEEIRLRVELSENLTNEKLQVAIDDCLEYIMKELNNDFKEKNGQVVIPGAIKMAVAKMVKLNATVKEGVASQSVEGLSISYQTASGANGMTNIYGNILAVVEPYRKSRSRFVPFSSGW